jgi:hypothetical protein
MTAMNLSRHGHHIGYEVAPMQQEAAHLAGLASATLLTIQRRPDPVGTVLLIDGSGGSLVYVPQES